MMTIKGKVLTILLALAFNAFAAEWTGANSEPATTKTIDGKKFYVVVNPDELAWIANQVNNGNTDINVYIGDDIVMGADKNSQSKLTWTSIGIDNSYDGIFEGNGHVIYGIKGRALFESVGKNGLVQNISIKSSSFNDSWDAASVAIYNSGTIRNCFNYSTVYVSSGYNAAGIAVNNSGVIENCHNYGNVGCQKRHSSCRAGGLVSVNHGTVNRSTNSGEISSTTYDGLYSSYAGGLVAVNNGVISDGFNSGNINSNSADHTCFAGGLVGLNQSKTALLINSFSVSEHVNGCHFVGSSSNLRGGIAGVDTTLAVVNNSYYDISFDKTLKDFFSAANGNVINSSGKQTESMQKDQFAWILNTANGSEENRGVWSRYDGYPVYANDTLLAIHKIVFDDGENTSVSYTNFRGLVEKFPDYPEVPEGKAFAGWMKSNGGFVETTTVFTEDQTVTAVFKDWEDVVYSIRFLDEKGNVLDLKSVHSGEIPVYGGAEPTKKSTVAYTYTFKGWSPEIAPAVWHTDYTVMFDSIINQYKVSYVDYDGTELFSSMFDYGTKPTYSTIPKKTNTVAYLYSFVGWSPAVENVSGEAVYKAIYDSVLQKYSIEFKANGETLLSKDYDYGSVPKYENATPTKPATKAYSYSFAGWEPAIAKVTEATSYTAKFDSSLNKYMVVFQNGAKVLQDSEIEYGKVPVYEGETPKKTSTAKYDYSFSSWSPALTKVTDEATYTALFDSTLRSYEVSFVSEGETLLAKEYEYGTFPKFEGNEPSKKESKGFTYSFKGWNPSVAMVKDKTVYTAVFDSVAKTFVVTFMNGKDTLQSTAVAYGNTPEYKGKTPTKSGSDKYEFKFSGWSPKLATVTEEAVYKAVFDSTTKQGLSINRILGNNFVVQVSGMQVWITNARIGSPYALFDLQGHVVAKGVVDQKSFVINAENRGRYIVRIGKLSKNVSVK